jgi:hypothetical protein
MRPLCVIGVLSTLALAGCYASTEPATNIGPETAQLNAKGTANNGEAQSYFEYWLTGSTQETLVTRPWRDWPAGVSGPFSEVAKDLAAGSSYSFRVCGDDPGRTGIACAQTRTFTTKPAVEDAVLGSHIWSDVETLYVTAHSTATGANPHGTVRFCCGDPFSGPIDYNGTVTCLAVSGNKAAIGSADGDEKILVTVVDGRQTVDKFSRVVTHGSALPDCAHATFGSEGEPFWPGGDIVVNDASQ